MNENEIDLAEAQAFQAFLKSYQNSTRQIGDVLDEFIAELEQRVSYNSEMLGISTGLSELDRITLGLRPRSLTVIASRPSMGKTSLALNIASHVALDQKAPVVVFSMGVSAIQYSQMLVSHNSKINCHLLSTARLENDEWEKITSTIVNLQNTKLYIDETPSLAVDEICFRTQNIYNQNGGVMGLIVVDDLQCISPVHSEKNSPEEWESVMSSLKDLGLGLKAPIVVLSQLARATDRTLQKDSRPQIADLPAPQIGQFADLLLFIHRDECCCSDGSDNESAELIIGRNRFGNIGMVRLNYCCELNSFSDYDYSSQSEI